MPWNPALRIAETDNNFYYDGPNKGFNHLELRRFKRLYTLKLRVNMKILASLIIILLYTNSIICAQNETKEYKGAYFSALFYETTFLN